MHVSPKYANFSASPDFIGSVGWKGLLFLNVYRVAIAVFLAILSELDIAQARSEEVAQVFTLAIWLYMFLAVLQASGLLLKRLSYLAWVSTGMLLDVLVFSIFNFAVTGGYYFNILLLVSLSGAAVLARGPIAWVYASMVVLALLFQALQLFLLEATEERHFIPIAIYCVSSYIVVWGARRVCEYMDRTENIAESIAAHLGNINDRIIDILRAGIIVVDVAGKVLFVNRPAIHLLECKQEPEGLNLQDIAPELAAGASSTAKSPERSSFRFNGIDAQVIKLPERYGIGEQILITMEQSSVVKEQAETMKNASLAKMAASITHEIRNPLGAISHAAQLLEEAKCLDEDGKEIASVIVRQAARMDTIVTNITQMGRAVPTYEIFELLQWVHNFASEMRGLWSLEMSNFEVNGTADVMVEADKSQLHQALSNLCENAKRYSTTSPYITLSVGYDGDMYGYIDIADSGPGIDRSQIKLLFEPFSSSSGGLGLGLYISRELVKANGGSLLLLRSDSSGSVFRLRLQRWSSQ